MWIPDTKGVYPDLLATSGDYLRVWRVSGFLEAVVMSRPRKRLGWADQLLQGVEIGVSSEPKLPFGVEAVKSWIKQKSRDECLNEMTNETFE